MHPILSKEGRLLLYLAAWIPGGLLLVTVVVSAGGLELREAAALALPMSQVYAFICLAAWYPSRQAPLSRAGSWRAVGTHLLAGTLSCVLWLLAGGVWAKLLARFRGFELVYSRFVEQLFLFAAFGLLLYLLAAAASYLLLAFAASSEAERRALEAQKNQELAARDLELARDLQRRLLPPFSTEGEGYRIEARYRPASIMAGDFFDYFTAADGSLRVAVADVSGKGVAASLVMASVKGVLPLMAAKGGVDEALAALGRKLESELAPREFVALALARFNPADGMLELANAGLPDPYLLRPGEAPRVLEVPPPRLPLGVRSEVEYACLRLELKPGDRLLMLSDGLPEAPIVEGEPLGYEAFEALLDADFAEPGAWLDGLLARLERATVESQEDDWTALLFERPPASEG